MTEPQVTIRPGRLPDDRAVLERYVHELQAFEAEFEPNRRLDDRVAREYVDVLLLRVAERDGRIFIAELDGAPVGWLLTHLGEDQLYVREEDRRFGLLAELYLEDGARGTGIGRRLIAAGEADFKARGVTTVLIGVLPGNTRARSVYRAAGFTEYAIDMRKRI